MVTRVFRLPAEKYFKMLFFRFLRRNSWWLAALAGGMLAALCWNPDVLYVLLILLFLVLPLLVLMKYFEYAAGAQTRRNVLDKYLEIDGDKIRFHFVDGRTEQLLWSDIRFCRYSGTACLLFTDKTCFIYVPRDAFASAADYQSFCRQVSDKINAQVV